jgi:starvation-inducible DNA-binding protein
VLAERIRALGAYAPNTIGDIMKPADIKGADKMPQGLAMAADLANRHLELSKHIAEAIEISMEVGDEATADMLIARQQFHDKTAWMLNAISK